MPDRDSFEVTTSTGSHPRTAERATCGGLKEKTMDTTGTWMIESTSSEAARGASLERLDDGLGSRRLRASGFSWLKRLCAPFALVAFAAVATGCLDDELDQEQWSEDEVQSETQAINSTVPIFPDNSCTAAEQDLLSDAFKVANFWLNTWPWSLENCMADVFLSPDYHETVTAPEDSVETIMQRMRENMPTKFAFVDDFVTNFHG